MVATWRRNKYRFGARFGYATGTPYTPIVGEIARRVYDPSRDSWGTGNSHLWIESLGGARNAARFPATHRLDLDASRELQFRGATVSPYISVVNAYNAQQIDEVFGVDLIENGEVPLDTGLLGKFLQH